jgi:hypothetical protein
MASEFRDIDAAVTWDSLLAMLAAPVVLPLASAIKQPTVREVIKQGIVLSEQCQEAMAEIGEHWEDLVAEANAVMAERGSYMREMQPNSCSESAQVTADIWEIATDLNRQTVTLTQGWLDLPTLFAMGCGAIALRQLLTKGIHLDDIPWYVMAWYGFDSFVKLHPPTDSQAQWPPVATPTNGHSSSQDSTLN